MRFYKSPYSSNRLVSVEEIAAACCVPKRKVQTWTAAGLLAGVDPCSTLFEAASVVHFLVTSRLPVPHSLLPPKTKRILFVSTDKKLHDSILNRIHRVCLNLAATHNILLESCTSDSRINLFILQGQPDLIIRYLSQFPSRPEPIEFPQGSPLPPTVLIASDQIRKRLAKEDTTLHADLILSSSCRLAEATDKINQLFEG